MGRWKKGQKMDYLLEYSTVQHWQNRLRTNGLKNTTANSSTKSVYLYKLSDFNQWFKGRPFSVKVTIIKNNKMIHENTQKTFDNVEKLLDFGEEVNGNVPQIKKIVSMYLDGPIHEHLSCSSMDGICLQ